MAKQYVIRFKDGEETAPLSKSDVEKLILSGKLKENDEISVYPSQIKVAIQHDDDFQSYFQKGEATLLFDQSKITKSPENERTRLYDAPIEVSQVKIEKSEVFRPEEADIDPSVQKEKTVFLERPKELIEEDVAPGKKRFSLPKKSFLVVMMLALVIYDFMDDDDDEVKSKPEVVMVPVRPELPSGSVGKVDPERSVGIYNAGLKPYLEDTVQGYRKATDYFQKALQLDPQNVKALAMLASSYLNLIESSNKDEKTFAVINKLIELSRLKDLDLVETLMAEVEFLAASSRYDAAIQRLVEYSKVTGKFDPILYYYIGWLYAQKHEYAGAMKYLNQIPASALPIPKLYYLRGFLHEENNEFDEARAEYDRARKINPKHAKSILGIIRVAEKQGNLKQMLPAVEFLNNNPSYLNPKEYVTSLIYRSKLALLFKNNDEAIRALERAIRIDSKNEDLRLEYYTLLSQSSTSKNYKNLAQMYSLVLEGERNMRAGKIHEAITVLIQAKDVFPKSEVPLEKMGDLFYQTGEYQKALQNYKKAIERNPKASEIAVKLIDSLIKNHEWEDAQKYLARYRTHPLLKSSIDRLAGDLAFHQGNYLQAIIFYKKAMARDSIDTEVYSSYANALKEMDQCKDAQFFYSLALRLDPFNYNAITGAAKCLLITDNVNTAVTRIQDELARLPKVRADLLAAIAEIYALAHDDDRALQFSNQAIDVDADYPESYRIQGLVYLGQMISKKDAKKKALETLKAFSDRKPSDPFGYLQRFEIFMKDSDFEHASEELNRVFEVSPRYPELHYRRAQLLAKMGRTKDALVELQDEIKLNPRIVKVWVEIGGIHARANDPDEAMKAYVKAMELDPQNSQAKVGAGYVNYLKRQFPSAIALYQAALALDRGNPDIYKKLGMAYRDSGDAAMAAKSFRSYLDLAPDAADRNQFEQYR